MHCLKLFSYLNKNFVVNQNFTNESVSYESGVFFKYILLIMFGLDVSFTNMITKPV